MKPGRIIAGNEFGEICCWCRYGAAPGPDGTALGYCPEHEEPPALGATRTVDPIVPLIHAWHLDGWTTVDDDAVTCPICRVRMADASTVPE